jgi:SAM-dependent methyltransferase
MIDERVHHRRQTCRICDRARLSLVLSFGSMPLANAFLSGPQDFENEQVYPLDLCYCPECSFLQLVDVVAPEVLFGHYLYASGTSDTMAAHHRDLAATVVADMGLGADDTVMEIASNDGSLLKHFQARGIQVVGIEPAQNIARMARAAGIPTVETFFNAATAAQVKERHGPPTVVLANNVLAHVDDPRDFLVGARTLVRPGGAIIVEVPYVGDLLDRLEYDTVYHEHLGYFSIRAFLTLADAVGLTVQGIDRVPVHGGSLRVRFSRAEDERRHADGVLATAEAERDAGLHDVSRYEQFRAGVERNRNALVGLLEALVASGKTVAGYGAPAKGNTLLTYCGIDSRLLPYTVDKSPLKTGLFTPGSHIPVLPVSAIMERRPDYLLLLAWNFAEEIISQQADYRTQGGRFIVPIPEPLVV